MNDLESFATARQTIEARHTIQEMIAQGRRPNWVATGTQNCVMRQWISRKEGASGAQSWRSRERGW